MNPIFKKKRNFIMLLTFGLLINSSSSDANSIETSKKCRYCDSINYNDFTIQPISKTRNNEESFQMILEKEATIFTRIFPKEEKTFHLICFLEKYSIGTFESMNSLEEERLCINIFDYVLFKAEENDWVLNLILKQKLKLSNDILLHILANVEKMTNSRMTAYFKKLEKASKILYRQESNNSKFLIEKIFMKITEINIILFAKEFSHPKLRKIRENSIPLALKEFKPRIKMMTLVNSKLNFKDLIDLIGILKEFNFFQEIQKIILVIIKLELKNKHFKHAFFSSFLEYNHKLLAEIMPCLAEYPELTFEILKIIIGFNKKNDIQKILLILSKSNCFLFTICEFSVIIFHMENYLKENDLTVYFMNFFQIFILEYLTSDKFILSQRLCESWDENKWGYENDTETTDFYKNELLVHMEQYCKVFIDSPAKIVTDYCQENIIGTPLKYIINVLNHLEFEIKLWIERNSTPSSTYISYSDLEFIANKILYVFPIKKKIGENSLFIFAINLGLKYAPIFLAKYLNIINKDVDKNNDKGRVPAIMDNGFESLCNQQQEMLNAPGFSYLRSYHQENYLEKSIDISGINNCKPDLKNYLNLSAHNYHFSIIFEKSLEKSISSLKKKRKKKVKKTNPDTRTIVQDRNSVTKTRSDEKMLENLNGECSYKFDGKNNDYLTSLNPENDKFKNLKEKPSETISDKQGQIPNKKAQKRTCDSSSGNRRALKPPGSKKARKSTPCEPKEKFFETEINPIDQKLKIAEIKKFFDNWNFMYLFNENVLSSVFNFYKKNNEYYKNIFEILSNSKFINNLNNLVSVKIASFLIELERKHSLEKCCLEILHHEILFDILKLFHNSQKIPNFDSFPQLYWLSKKELDSRHVFCENSGVRHRNETGSPKVNSSCLHEAS